MTSSDEYTLPNGQVLPAGTKQIVVHPYQTDDPNKFTAEWYYNDLGDNYEELKNYKEAVAHYDTAYYLFKDPIMLYNCGRISESLLKNTAMARKYFMLYLKTAHPQSPEEKKAYNYVRTRWGKSSKNRVSPLIPSP